MALTDTQLLQLAQHGAKARIEELRQEIATLQALISGNGMRSSIKTAARPTPPTARRRRISAAGRARIAAAQKARWAKIKGTANSAGETTQSARAKGARKRRGMSPAQRAAVSRRMKAYWAKRRAARAKK